MAELNPELADQISLSRGEFIEDTFDKIFGEEDMGDPSAELNPSDVTAILAAYEDKLAADGLLRVRKEL